MKKESAFELIEFVWRSIPLVGVGKGLPTDSNHRPSLRQRSIQRDKFTLTIRHIILSKDGLCGALGHAKRAINAFVRVDRQKVGTLVKAVNRADFHAVRVFALDAVLSNNVSHFSLWVVGKNYSSFEKWKESVVLQQQGRLRCQPRAPKWSLSKTLLLRTVTYSHSSRPALPAIGEGLSSFSA
jgi:hypothetical protein